MTTKEKFERFCVKVGCVALVCSVSSAFAIEVDTFVASTCVFFAAIFAAAFSYECVSD